MKLKIKRDDIITIIFIIVIIISVYVLSNVKEQFSQSIRYMWMYNPSSRNSSYDIRAEPIYHKKNLEKIGGYYESSYDNNQTNQRVRKYYNKYKKDTPEDNSQFDIMTYSKR